MTRLTALYLFVVAAPVEIADLEESMILTAIRIQAPHCSRVKGGFVLSDANPCRDLLHWYIVLVVKLLCKLTALVNLTFGLWLGFVFLQWFFYRQHFSIKAAGNLCGATISAVSIVYSPSRETVT